MNKADTQAVPLNECTYLGGYGFPFAAGESIEVHFGSKGMVAVGKTRAARFSHLEVVELSISGPGRVSTGGGFVGGGFGVEGALEGIAVAGILNALTKKTSINTFISLITNFGELHLHYSGMEPGALRIALAYVFQRMRQSSPDWLQLRRAVIETASSEGQIDDTQKLEMLSRLATRPAWPDAEAEAQLRASEEADRAQVAEELAPKGICPNCDRMINAHLTVCPHCKAHFGPGSAWKIKPLIA